MKWIFKYIFSLLLVFLIASPALHAKQISPETAMLNASDFFAKTKGNKVKGTTAIASLATLTLAQTVKDAKSTPLFYVFSRGNDNGFVIASADDRLIPILGYTDKGTFESIDKLPEIVGSWIKNYEISISNYYSTYTDDQQDITTTPKYREPIEEMLESWWGQDSPFNKKAPIMYGLHSPIGCVGLAMAMIVKHHQYPEKGKGYKSYSSGGNTVSFDYDNTVFNYDNMEPYYDGSETEEEYIDVANLAMACAVAVSTEFGESGSGADLSAKAFSTYFNYPETGLALLNRNNFSPEEWEDIIYTELENDCPVLYRGDAGDSKGGHAFVCDGYKDGLFHFNWGWYGDCNGYYSLNILRPSSGGIGANDQSIYSINQKIVRGLRSPSKKIPTPIFVAESVKFHAETDSCTFTSLNAAGNQNVIYPGLKAINKSTGEVKYIPSTEPDTPITLYNAWLGGASTLTVSFMPNFTGLEDGEYEFRPVVRIPDDDSNPGHYTEWVDIYPTFANERYFLATLSNGKIQDPESGFDIKPNATFTDFQINSTLIIGHNYSFSMHGRNDGNTILSNVYVFVYEHENPDQLAVSSGYQSRFVLEPGNESRYSLALPNMTKAGDYYLQVRANSNPLSTPFSDKIPFSILNGNDSYTFDGIKYLILSEKDKTAVAIRNANPPKYNDVIEIPEYVNINGNTYTVTEISTSFALNCTNVTKVVLPSTIKSIASSAFNGCSSLSEINLPAGLEYLGGSVFNSCKALNTITLPKGLKEIGYKAFGYSGINTIELPEGIESIGEYAFASCPLTRVVLPSTLKFIGNYAFDNIYRPNIICRAIEPPVLSENTFSTTTMRYGTLFVPLESLDTYGQTTIWENFINLYPINTEQFVKVDGLWYELTQDFEAFVIQARDGETYSMTKVDIPDVMKYMGMEYVVTEISENAFSGNKTVTTVTGGGRLKKIGNHAFESSVVTGFSFADGLEEIGDHAFNNANIGSISKFPDNLKKIGDYAFAGNKRLGYYKGLYSTSNWLALPTSLNSIGEGAFEGCVALDKLQISSDIELGENLFDGCTAFKAMYLKGSSISLNTVKVLASRLDDTYFYIDKANREYFKGAFDEGSSRLYDLLKVTSITWEGHPTVSGMTDIIVQFDSSEGNPTTTYFIIKNSRFEDIASMVDNSYDNYSSTGSITLTLAPFALGTGNAQITFDQPGLTEMFNLEIVKTANLIETITLSETNKTISVGSSFTLESILSPENLDDSRIVWSSSNTSVVSVDENGKVTAVGPGTAAITCKSLLSKATAKCNVEVTSLSRPGKALDDDDPYAEITVADVVAIANHIMGNTPANFNETNADANGDGKISVADVATTVKIILDREEALEEDEEAEETVLRIRAISEQSEDNFLHFGEILFENSNLLVNFASLEAMDDFTALQADIICPTNVEISNIELDKLSSHTLSWKKLNNGNYRVVVYSLSNVLLPVSPTPILKLSLNKGGNPSGAMSVTNAWVSTPDAKKANLYASGGSVEIPTGIGTIYTDFPEPYAEVFTVDGVLIKRNVEIVNLKSELAPGIYILRGLNNTAKVVIN